MMLLLLLLLLLEAVVARVRTACPNSTGRSVYSQPSSRQYFKIERGYEYALYATTRTLKRAFLGTASVRGGIIHVAIIDQQMLLNAQWSS